MKMNYQQQKIDQKILFIFVTNTGLTSRVQHLLYSTAQYTVSLTSNTQSATYHGYSNFNLVWEIQISFGTV